MTDDIKLTINKQLILNAFKNKLMIHIVLQDGVWRNGIVKEVNTDFFLFKDRERPIEPYFYLELKDVKPYMEEK